MLPATPLPTDLAARRAELEAVLQSKCFTRAPTLAHLLAYLCERLFAGEASQIKEYSVGVEVFRRGPSFDQVSDSIVRVEANRLRKRLAEYYAGEGAEHPLHITIPLGQYVPEFVLVRQLAAERSEPEEAASQAGRATPANVSAGEVERPARRLGWRGSLAAALALAVLGSGAFLFFVLRQEKPVSGQFSDRMAALPMESQLGPPAGNEIRILAGAGRSFVDHAGKLWSADAWFEGGTAEKSAIPHIWRTLDPGFYRTSRQGQFRYDIPLKRGIYELRLHFAETVYDPESSGSGGEGSRLMTVRANGKTLLSRFDLVADAGASRTADVKVFTDIAPAPDGLLHLDFSGEDGMQATLSAIEILPGFRGRIRPVRLLARQTPYYSNDSHWWSPDNYFQGGQMASYSAPVQGTDDPELYETERWGNFSYAIPVTPGRYTVYLHFAVRRGDWDRPSSASDEDRLPVAHIFNVFCNGGALLKNFDLPREAGKAEAIVRKFTGLYPNSQGKLVLSFVPVEGYATVTGIEVLPQ
jgi:hypothetical protein